MLARSRSDDFGQLSGDRPPEQARGLTRRLPETRQRLEICPLCATVRFRSIRKSSNGGCRIDHRLMVVPDEAAAGSIEIQDQEDDSGDEHSHDVDGWPRSGG